MANYCLALARNLRTIRIERHIPLAELAAASGVNVTTLCELEAGISRIRGQRRRGRNMINPQFFTIVRVAVALGVSPSEVMP